MIGRLAIVGATVILLAAAPAAQASTITISNITAAWSNAIPTANATFSGTPTNPSANWGTPAGTPPLQSGYDFLAASPAPVTLPPTPSSNFVIGTFTHRNNPIDSGTSITSIRLTVNANVSIDGNPQVPSHFVFDFLHNETPNADAPCADGGTVGVGVDVNGCADSVTFQYNSLSDSFTIGADLYTVTLRGFLVGGNPVTTFWTQEQANSSASLVAFVTLRADATQFSTTPEPASMVLLSTGLVGLAVRQWRRKRAA